MFYGMHGRGCGTHRGSFRRGPFEVHWDISGVRGGGGRHGGRGRRMFDGGELRLVLLKLIGDQPRHGYDLIREIEELTGGAYAPSPGVIYPTLTLLEDMGLVDEEKSEGSRKLFSITADGAAHLKERAEEVAALFDRLSALGAWRERTGGSGPVRRAMGNLKTVLQQKLGDEDAGEELQHQVAAIIDEAVQKIERLK